MKLARIALLLAVPPITLAARVDRVASAAEPPSLSALDIVGEANASSDEEIPAAVVERIKAGAAKRHPDDYSTIQFVIDNQIQAFEQMHSH